MRPFIFFFVMTVLAQSVLADSPKIKSYTIMTATSANLSDQNRCQAEADYMAQHHITTHVWGTIGNFEGVGYGSSPNCNTCVPKSNMRLTGDAHARDNNGRYYRVRSWRY